MPHSSMHEDNKVEEDDLEVEDMEEEFYETMH